MLSATHTAIKGSNLLIVDDDPLVRRFFGMVMKEAGATVQMAEDVETAENIVREGTLDVAVVDINLPRKSGIELLRTIRQTRPEVPVILVTGFPTIESASDALRLEAYDYLPKPIETKQLIITVQRACETRALRAANQRMERANRRYQQQLETLLKERTQKLGESEARYKALFEGSRDAILISRPEGPITDFNAAACELFGYTAAQMAQLDARQLYVDPNDRQSYQQELVQSGSVQDYEVAMQRRDGERITCLITARVRYDAAGRPAEYEGIIRDITLRKQAEQKILRQNEFLSNILESLSHPFYVIDAQTHRVVLANSAAYRIIGESGDTCYALTHKSQTPCDEKEHPCPLREVMRTRRPVRVEHVHYDTAYDARHFEIHGHPVFDKSGAVVQMIEYSIDITERVKAQQEMSRLRAAVEQSGDAILITDTAGIVQYANPAFERVTGFAREDVLGRDCRKLGHAEESTAACCQIWDSIRAKQHAWQGHMTSRRKDGSIYEEECAISPIRNERQEIQNYVLVKRDITERKRLESIAEAANLMENIGFIFSGIRHELGNPVNTIKMTLSVLDANLEQYPAETNREFITRAIRELERVEYLLRSLKSFSLFEHPSIVPTRIESFIDSLLSLVADDLARKGIEVTTVLDPAAEVMQTDPRALQQVMLNLIINAADAVQDVAGPRIRLAVARHDAIVRIVVEDNGCGIPAKEQGNLFKPFFTTKAKGTGLGLVIVKNMLVKLGATIEVVSREKRGTTAILNMPGGHRGA